MTRGGPWPHVGLAATAVAVAAVLADPAPRVQVAFTFTDRDIAESSGLALRDGLVLTVNDSGSDPVVYAVDPATGETVGRTTYTSEEVEDVEALAVGPDGTVWVADIGDNGRDRSSVAVYAVPGVGRGDRAVDAPRYELTYRGRAHDAETLLVDPRDGRLYVVSKGLFGGDVFAAPRELRLDRPNLLQPLAGVDGMLTDGTMTADGTRALLRGYGRVYVVDTGSWRHLADMALPEQRQGEGIAVADDVEELLVSSEGARTAVLAVPLSGPLVDALTGDDRDAAGSGAAEAADPPGAEDAGPSTLLVAGLAVAGALGVLAVGLVVGLVVRGARRRSRSTP